MGALVVAWYHGEQGRQRASGVELLMLGALLAIAAALVALVSGPGSEADAAAGSVALGGIPDDLSIAVKPFDNRSADPDNEYFSDGMTEEILTTLAGIEGPRVISRTSVMPYKRTDKSLREIAAELQVAYVLEGSVRREGNDVRISAQLIRASDGAHVWAANYDRRLEDIFRIQARNARGIAGQLEAQLSAETSTRLAGGGTTDMEAYDLYLRGREYLSRPGNLDRSKYAPVVPLLLT